MNIKTMMAALACAATVGFSASAGTTQWFNGGLTADWPNAAGMNAKWSGDSTNTSSFAEGKLSIVLDDNKDPLVLTADSTKVVGTDVDSATFTITAGFSAYDEDGLPGVPTDAKAGVTFVSTNDNDTAGVFYYLAYDGTSGVESNVWVATEVSANITGGSSAAQGIEVTLAPGETGFWAVTYKFEGDDPTTIKTTVKKVGTDYAGEIEFSGNGPGYATVISAEYADKTYALTANVAGDNLEVTNVAIGTTYYGWPCRVPKGAENITVFFKTVGDYKFTGDNTATIAGPVNADFVINSDTVTLPEVESAKIEIKFFKADTGAQAFTNYFGVPGTDFPAADSNYVCTAANDFDNQMPGTWWDGTWSDGSDPIAFPAKFPKVATSYIMATTNITYKFTVKGASGVNVLVAGVVRTTFDADDDKGVVTLSGDPTEIPAGMSKFLGWTCAYFDVTEPVSAATFNGDSHAFSFEDWDDFADIEFVANWEEQKGFMIYVAGEEKYYDTIEAAFAAVADGQTIKVMKDGVIGSRMNLAADKNVTLDMNGKTLTITGTLYPIVWGYEGTATTGKLTITGDGTFQQNAEITGGWSPMILWAKKGEIEVLSGTFNVTKGKGQIGYVSTADGKITVKGGTFTICDNPETGAKGDVFNVAQTQGVTKSDCIQCSGGNFSKDMAEGDDALGPTFVAEGYYSVPAANSRWEVVDATGLAAAIGDHGYATLADAVAAVAANQTIKLLNNVTLGAQLLINRDVAFTIDGANKTITATAGITTPILVQSTALDSAALCTIQDVTIDGIDCVNAVINAQKAKLDLSGVTIQNCTVTNGDRKAVINSDFAEIAIDGCVIQSNTSDASTILCNTQCNGNRIGSFALENSLVKDNVTHGTGVFYVNYLNATSRIIGNTFEGNTDSNPGATAVCYFSTVGEVTGNLFKNNVINNSGATETDKKVGVICGGSGSLSTVVTNNAFVGNSITAVTGQASGTLFVGGENWDANANYWNDGEAPETGDGKDIYATKTCQPTTYLASYTAKSSGRGIEVGTPTPISAGPTPAAGSETAVTKNADGEYVLTPTGTGTTVAVDDVKAGDVLVVGAAVTEIGVQGGAESGVIIKVWNSGNTATIPNDAMYGWDGNSFGTALNPEAEVGGVKVQPTAIEAESTEGTIADGAVATAAIPGLTYELKRGTELGDYSTIEGATTAKKTATGSSVTLKDDTTKPTTKAFYVIEVTK